MPVAAASCASCFKIFCARSRANGWRPANRSFARTRRLNHEAHEATQQIHPSCACHLIFGEADSENCRYGSTRVNAGRGGFVGFVVQNLLARARANGWRPANRSFARTRRLNHKAHEAAQHIHPSCACYLFFGEADFEGCGWGSTRVNAGRGGFVCFVVQNLFARARAKQACLQDEIVANVARTLSVTPRANIARAYGRSGTSM